MHKSMSWLQTVSLVRKKAEVREGGLKSKKWLPHEKAELQTICGGSLWTSIYVHMRVATTSERCWQLVLQICDMWDRFELKGQVAPKTTTKKKLGARVAKVLRAAHQSLPLDDKSREAKKFPSSHLVVAFTNLPESTTYSILQKLIRNEFELKDMKTVRGVHADVGF